MEIQGNKSLPSSFGHLTESLFDHYPIYRFELPSTITDKYLPNKLIAFASKTLTNLSKRYFFYCKPIIYASRCQLSQTNEQISSQISLSDLLKELFSSHDSTLRYNFVILGNSLIFARIPRLHHVTYHILCKHATLSNRSMDVRFAGELWSNDKQCFQLNNNSGTYRPSNRLIEQTIELFNQLIPSIQFDGMDFRTNARPSVRHRIPRRYRHKHHPQQQQQTV